ncbi:DUF2812 domain-containing protein [Erysipelotrichaceae bacterium RD49]|nr:DUF2812 domain-containing protein [Erysipelotrichaceae bacterium RD49]
MAEDQKKTTGNSIDDTIFQDLLSDSRISSLEIKEPEFDSFDVQSVIQEARTVSSAKKSSANPFGKRSRRNKPVRQQTPAFNEQSFFASKAQRRQEQETTAMAQDSFKETNPEDSKPEAAITPAAQEQVQVLTPAPDQPAASEKEVPAFMQTRQEEGQTQKPKTFAEILHNARYQENQKALENMDLFDDPVIETPLFQQAQASEPAPSEPSVVITRKSQSELLLQAQNETEAEVEEEIEQEPAQAGAVEQEADPKGKRSRKNKAAVRPDQNEADEEVFDPGASIVDDYHYDEYEDKKRFSTTDYRKIEDYLTNESAQGFHFVRHDGNKYFFNKSTPRHYYYKVLYFGREPEDSYWNQLEKQGWKRIEQMPSRHKRDAGWYIVRNEKKAGELPKDIENEEEKYRYFTKLSSSCRSTMFLLFIVMVCSAIAVFLQYYFKGYIAVMIASAVLFLIALWIFLVYARMLSKARKQASLLSARIRLASNDPNYLALRHAGESDEQLDLDWDEIDAQDKLGEPEDQDEDQNKDDAYDDEDYRDEEDEEDEYDDQSDDDEEDEDEKPRRRRWGRRRR